MKDSYKWRPSKFYALVHFISSFLAGLDRNQVYCAWCSAQAAHKTVKTSQNQFSKAEIRRTELRVQIIILWVVDDLLDCHRQVFYFFLLLSLSLSSIVCEMKFLQFSTHSVDFFWAMSVLKFFFFPPRNENLKGFPI